MRCHLANIPQRLLSPPERASATPRARVHHVRPRDLRGLMNREFSLEVSFGTKLAVAIFAATRWDWTATTWERPSTGPHFPGTDAERRVDEWAAWWRQLWCAPQRRAPGSGPIGLCPVDLQSRPVYAAAVGQAKKWEADILTLGLQVASPAPPSATVVPPAQISSHHAHPCSPQVDLRASFRLILWSGRSCRTRLSSGWFAEQLHRWRRYGADRIR